MITYEPLWKLLIEKKMTKEQLRNKIGVSSQTMTNMHQDKPVNLKYIDRICKELNCTIPDIIEYRDS